jgi:hypothetical protein
VGTAPISNFRLCVESEIFHVGEKMPCNGRTVFLPIVK